ncbi:hypothetical protein OG216_35765 [Streptomycetaceae bacterium NBC_01309]
MNRGSRAASIGTRVFDTSMFQDLQTNIIVIGPLLAGGGAAFLAK